MNSQIFTYGLIFASISQAITTILIFLHIWIPKLLKHPGEYVLIQCVLQFLYDLHWIGSYSSINSTITTPSVCSWLGILVITVYNLGLYYTMILGIEMVIKFRNIGNIAYYKRSLIYHGVGISSAIIIDLIIYALGGYGISNVNTCAINSSSAKIVEYVPRILYLLIMLFTVVYLKATLRKNYSRIIINYYFIIFFVIMTWGMPSIIILIFEEYEIPDSNKIAYLVGTLSGTVIGLARLIDAKLFREVYKKTLSKSEKEIFNIKRKNLNKNFKLIDTELSEGLIGGIDLERHSGSINCFGDLFESMSRRVKNI